MALSLLWEMVSILIGFFWKRSPPETPSVSRFFFSCASCSNLNYNKHWVCGSAGRGFTHLARTRLWVRLSAPDELALVVHTRNPSAQEVGTGGSEV